MSIFLVASFGSVGTLKTRVMEATIHPSGLVQLPGIVLSAASLLSQPYSTANGRLFVLGTFRRGFG